jgi:nitroimidazol reductase NimA-like FMN-containing flavoprotein (pyridoxamine 5'-phosphate oxidase superfamily)
MRIRELTELECSDILQHSELGHLACTRHDQPYIVPIHFSFDNQRKCLYAFSTVGQKIEWMRENPRVCVEVEDIKDKNHWTTVLIFGVYEELTDTAAEASAKNRAQRLFERRPEWWFPAAAKTDSGEHHAIVIYRIRIDRMTGRRASRQRPHAPVK